MAKKTTKKVDVKAVAKVAVMEHVRKALEEKGYVVKDGEQFGFTKGTLVVETESTDIQIKPITPKAGIDRYEVEEEETEPTE